MYRKDKVCDFQQDWRVINTEINDYLSNYVRSKKWPDMLNMNKDVQVFWRCKKWAKCIFFFTCIWSHRRKWSQYCSRYFRTSVWWTKEGRCFAKGKSGKDITSLGILVLSCEKNTCNTLKKTTIQLYTLKIYHRLVVQEEFKRKDIKQSVK